MKKDLTKFRKTNPKKKKKIIIWSIIGVILAVAICYVLIIYFNLNKVFSDNKGSVTSLFKKSTEKLIGENDGRVNFLLAGEETYSGAAHTDTLMVASLNIKDNKVAMISIPRDLYIKIPNNGYERINAVIQKNIDGVDGMDLLDDTVEKITDLKIPYYMKINFDGFTKLIDLFGGIDVYVERDLYDPYFPTDDYKTSVFKISKGQHHLDGATALRYARSRKTTSDFDRAKRQQQIIVAIKEKATSVSYFDINKIIQFSKIIGDNVRTNMSIENMKRMLELAKNISSDSVISNVLDNSADGLLKEDSSTSAYHLVPKLGLEKYSDIQEFFAGIFNQPSEDDPKIEIQNGAHKSGLAVDVSKILKAEGYNIYSIDTTDTVYSTSKIYAKDKTSQTVKKLMAKFNISTVSSLTSTSKADIILIIGKDYLK